MSPAVPAPALSVLALPDHPVVRSLLELSEADFAGILLHDGARLYVRGLLEDAERADLLSERSEVAVLNLARRYDNRGSTVQAVAELLPMLNALRHRGLHWLKRSTRDVMPRSLSELIEEGAAAERELCRDDACSGRHAWLVYNRPSRDESLWFVWHLDLMSGLVVPPTPMELA